MKVLEAWRTFEQSGIFAMMQKKLELRESRNYHDETIKDLPLFALINHVESEFKEFSEGVNKRDVENVKEECADIANCCAFIFSKLVDDPLSINPSNSGNKTEAKS